MENIALIGIDLGKNSFHIHCQDRHGKAIYRKKFSRSKLIEFLATCPATTIAMEACGGSHFMARRLAELGHSPKLISPQFVRPFVKTNKNDFVDAEAICEAASRPSMRFVQPRTESQQARGSDRVAAIAANFKGIIWWLIPIIGYSFPAVVSAACIVLNGNSKDRRASNSGTAP